MSYSDQFCDEVVMTNDQLAQQEAQWFMNIETLRDQMLECLAEAAWCCLENNGCCMTVQQYYMFPAELRKLLPLETYPVQGYAKTFMALRYSPRALLERLNPLKPLPQMFMELGYAETRQYFKRTIVKLAYAELVCAKFGGTCIPS